MRLILFFKKMVSGKEGRVARFAGLMALLAGLSLVYGRNLLKYSYHFGLYDWNFFLYQHQYWHISLFSFKQLPLWNPYACGGMSFIGRPDVSVLPFPIIFVTAFGALAGLRIMAVFYIFLGMTGMFYVCRYLKIGILPSLIAGVIFSMNGALALRIMAGHLGWLSVAYLPFIVLFYLKGLKKFRYLFLCSLFLAFVAAEGSYILMFTAVFLFVFSALYALQQKSLRPLLALGLTLALCVLLSGPKLFPMIEMMSQFPRGTDVGKAIPLKNLYNIFWERNQLGNLAFAFMRPLNWWEFGSYIGIVPVVIFVLSFKLVRRQWPLLLTAVCVFVIGLGNFSALAPWTLLHRAPVFCNMHISSRVWVIFLFLVALLCGLCLDSFTFKSRRGTYLKNVLLVIALCFIAWDLTAVSSPVFKNLFQEGSFRQKLVLKDQAFRQIRVPAQYAEVYDGLFLMFAPLLENAGAINSYEAIPVKRNAMAYGELGYRGEFYLLNHSGKVSQPYWSPNRLVFHYDIWRPDVLVVNQNYDKGWKTFPPRVVKSHKGLISVEIDPADKGIVLYYLPWSFVAGLLTCAAAMAAWAVMIRKKVEWKGPMGSGLW